MKYLKLILIVIGFIFNGVILYKVIKNKKKLSINSIDAINLNNINDKITNKLLIPILFLNFILILSNNVINEFITVWLTFYLPFSIILTPIIYISKTHIGTTLKCINTENISFVEITNFENNIKVICYFNDKTSKEIKFRLSLFKRSRIASKNISNALKNHDYKVYISS